MVVSLGIPVRCSNEHFRNVECRKVPRLALRDNTCLRVDRRTRKLTLDGRGPVLPEIVEVLPINMVRSDPDGPGTGIDVADRPVVQNSRERVHRSGNAPPERRTHLVSQLADERKIKLLESRISPATGWFGHVAIIVSLLTLSSVPPLLRVISSPRSLRPLRYLQTEAPPTNTLVHPRY